MKKGGVGSETVRGQRSSQCGDRVGERSENEAGSHMSGKFRA